MLEAVAVALPIKTMYGVFRAIYSARGLRKLEFPSPRTNSLLNHPRSLGARIAIRGQAIKWHRMTTRALLDALAGRSPRRLPPLDIAAATHFQKMVWAALRAIPPGCTRTYGEIARAIGKPGAARAVGAACKANPIPVLIPCHRVVASRGKLGGFTAGLFWKKILLACEQPQRSKTARNTSHLSPD
ncbi:MAG: methylated-DNA--[protein]-cysteine S-methyltransferase [Verrucomicrobiales bacterium]|nr:methylated-DNA--[protein]-cysteine S-methyltransferase [Verrucomicrobiales bacterium]